MREYFGGTRIDRQRFLESAKRARLVVLLLHQPARFVLRRPEALVLLDRLGPDFVEDEIELLIQLVPPRVLAARQTDQEQFVWIGDVLVHVAAGGVGLDEPAKLLARGLDLAAIAH